LALIQKRSFRLLFRYPFAIAHGVRDGTDAVFVKLSIGDHFGYGEATLPPYLEDSVETVERFLDSTVLTNQSWENHPDVLANYINNLIPGNYPAKAALNMAHWQLFLSLYPAENPFLTDRSRIAHTFTLGIDSRDLMKEKIDFALSEGFSFFKLKLNGSDDIRIIRDYIELCDHPFAVDANQSWKEGSLLDEVLDVLNKNNCVLIEQPFAKDSIQSNVLLHNLTDIPLIADESCQTIKDIGPLSEYFDGINIKLQKCGGISAASKMIDEARKHNLKVLIGCMSESSVGCNAAELLAPLCDWADLDGPWLIKNDPDVTAMFSNK
jgi:L-Ala-D/L-Glu epimerase